MKKLTLSADEDVIEQARRLAAESHTSVSAMFARFVRGAAHGRRAVPRIPRDSIAAKAAGFLSLPKDKTPREVLENALMDKYGIKK